jgi:hypothetical protein
MRRPLVIGALAAAVASAVGLSVYTWKPAGAADAAPGDKPSVALAGRSATALQLPVSQVLLFSSGVGYFQREGEVEGTARIDLTFPVQDVNDLLKSMVLRDLGGGHVSAVSYDGQTPIDRTLQSFAINLTGNPSFGQILNQGRGEKVEVVVQQSTTTQPGTLTGSIIGVEKQKQPAGKDGAAEVEQLNLWCAEGMRSVKLADVQRVRFLNPIIDSEFKKALDVLALSHDAQKKAVTLNFAGEGRRQVRVGYVIENPIWKTSYRLVLNKEGKPYLQGWAVVENPSDEDWNGVRMGLISGRPISFQMDLYQPLYVPRPVVEPELFASLRPPTYAGAMLKMSLEKAKEEGVNELRRAPERQLGDLSRKDKNGADNDASGQARGLGFLAGRGGMSAGKEALKSEALNLRDGVASAASAAQLGDFFRYDIDHPVSLPRQKSAMLPIVAKDVEGTRVSIYNEHTHAKFPLLGLRFKNATGLHLMQGPVTVFDGNSYAGDARVPDLQPNEERLLSYAIDLGTEVQAVPHSDNGRLTLVKVVKGVLHSTTKVQESKTYNLKNRSEQDRVVLIEHPFRPDFKLTSADKPVETASDVYRFEVKVPAGKEAKQVVSEERDLRTQVHLTNLDDPSMKVFLTSTVPSPAVKAALQKAGELKWQLARTQQEIQNVQRELSAIKQDQPRLRQNLEKIPGTDPLAKRILEKLNTQETEIEKYEAQLKQLQAQADQQRKDYEAYLAGLTVE